MHGGACAPCRGVCTGAPLRACGARTFDPPPPPPAPAPAPPPAHAQIAKWDEKSRSESGSITWLIANTKPCPKCSGRIEKNQGCNHMTCRNKGCKHEFCWICLGPWSDHGQATGGYYSCNKFKAGGRSEDGGDERSRAKAESEKYIWYFTRYDNHEKAGRFAAKHREAAQRVSLLAPQPRAGAGSAGCACAPARPPPPPPPHHHCPLPLAPRRVEPPPCSAWPSCWRRAASRTATSPS